MNGRSGTAKSLAYAPSTRTLYVLHSFGPDHLRLMSVDKEGRLTPRPERYTANTMEQAQSYSHNGRALAGREVRARRHHVRSAGACQSRWLTHPVGAGSNGTPHSVASNAPDPDGLLVFPVNGDGALGNADIPGRRRRFAFLPAVPERPAGYRSFSDTPSADGISINTLDEDGRVSDRPGGSDRHERGQADGAVLAVRLPGRSARVRGELRLQQRHAAFASTATCSRVAKDPACPTVPGDGTLQGAQRNRQQRPERQLAHARTAPISTRSTATPRSWSGTPTQPDGSLKEITSVAIPYNSPQGLAGF